MSADFFFKNFYETIDLILVPV